MEINDVFADKVILLYFVIGHEVVERTFLAVGLGFAGFEIRLQAREIADRRIQPHVKIFARLVGDFNTEVRRVARNIPVVDLLAARFFVIREPLGEFIDDFRLQWRLAGPLLQKLQAFFVRKFEKEMLGFFEYWLGTGKSRIGIF